MSFQFNGDISSLRQEVTIGDNHLSADENRGRKNVGNSAIRIITMIICQRGRFSCEQKTTGVVCCFVVTSSRVEEQVMSTDPLISELVTIAAYLNRSITVPILVLGTFGNLLNLVILTRKSLRGSSCVFYFLSSSVANLFCLWCGLSTRILSGYNLDPTTTNTVICRIRYYLTYKSLSLSAFFLIYASADRWASSSVNARTRRFCRVHFARRLVLATVGLATVLYSQAFYCYIASPSAFPAFCVSRNVVCRMYNDLLFLLIYSIIPPLPMIGFGWLTVRNVRRIHRQVSPTSSLMKRRDRQMVTMLIIQIGLFFLSVLPSGLSKAYSTLTFNHPKDTLQLTKENFSFQVTILMLYANCSCAFYVYTLTGATFRREIRLLLAGDWKRA